MLNKILMPSGGQTTDEMLILKWNKRVGDAVKRGDILFEIETDKAILEVESFAEGILLDVKYPESVMVKVGEVVALIGNAGDLEAVEKKEEKKVQVNPEAPPVVTAPAATTPAASSNGSRNKILASPLAKSLARAENVDLKEVAAFSSGPMIKKADINRFLQSRKVTPAAVPSITTDTDFEFVSNTNIRKTIARRMKESLSTAPHYIISIDVDMSAVIALRLRLNQHYTSGGIKLSYNDFLMRVVAIAIKDSPLVNSTYEENGIKLHRDVNIGLAVATATGIVVPVVPKVNTKTLSEIAAANIANIEKVKTGQLTESEMRGGTITISNLGMFGIDNFTAIINQPESCILAVGGISRKPVVKENEIVIRDVMNITGSFDHRVIDGAVGAPFMQKIKLLLEDPELLLY
jgi:pyruvate dehydrogenase E2 component (dihydrolipoamide acetyltransferase)